MRVFIYGSPGVGKTTLALALNHSFGWPVHHLDTLFFNPDGSARDIDEAMFELEKLANTQDRIIEGNHGAAIDAIAARADRVVVLPLGRWRAVWRLLRSRVLRPASLADKGPGGGAPKLPLHLIRYTLQTHPDLEPHHLVRLKRATSAPVRAFKDPSQVVAWLS